MQVLSHFVRYWVGLAAPETQTTAAERACLRRHARGCRRVAEIGVWHGVTTAELLRVMAPDGTLLAVDPFPTGRLGVSLQQPIARREVRRVGGAKVRWLRTTGAAAAAELRAAGEPPLDLVFIDGDHSYAGLAEDWAGWAPLVAPGGAVALHDSRSSESRRIDTAGSAVFTREVILVDPAFELVDQVDTLTVVRRRAVGASTGGAERELSSRRAAGVGPREAEPS